MFFDGVLQRDDIRQRRDRLQFVQRMIVFLRGENGDLLVRRHVAERELHRKPVHLRLRQRIRAAKFHRVLRGDDEKQFRQIPAFALDAHLRLAHRFEQGRLRARRGAVDFVRQQDVCEHRAFVKMKLLVALVENGNAQNVRRQQVRRELEPFELRVNGSGQRLGQRRLAGAGKILQQHMAARRERREQMPCGLALSMHDQGNVGGNFTVGFPGRFDVSRRHDA